MECNLSNVLDVLRRVGYSAAYWKELGRRLVPGLDANSVEVNHRLAQDRLEAVIDAWLRDGDLGEGGDGWRVLAAAVQKCRLGGGRNVAVRILREVETPNGPDSRPNGADSRPLQVTNGTTTSTHHHPFTSSLPPTFSPPSLSPLTSPSSSLPPSLPHPPSPSPSHPIVTHTPTIEQLRHLRCSSGTVFRIIRSAAQFWESLGCCLCVDSATIGILRRDHPHDVESACEKMLGVWLEGREGVRRPLTWSTLTAALRETGELPVLAANIETEINNHQ